MKVVSYKGIIASPEDVAERHTVIDDRKSSAQRLPRIFEVSDGGTIQLSHPATTISEFEKAVVCGRSDLVVLVNDKSNHVIWEKFFLPNMAKTKPLDGNIIKYDVSLRERNLEFWLPDEVGHVATAISLLGTHAAHWGHFMAEYLPRLVLTMSLMENEPVVVLIPAALDQNCIELIGIAIAGYPRASLSRVEDGQAVLCDRLVQASKGTYLCDHSDYASHFDVVVRHWVPEALESVLAVGRRMLGCTTPSAAGRKIYFPRKQGHRGLKNADEIQNIMEQRGFETIDPAGLSLKQKMDLLGAASKISLVAASSVFNSVFMPPGSSVFVVSPYVRAHDHVGSTMRKDIEFDVVSGVDDSSDVHTSFWVDPDRVRRAMDSGL